MGSTSESEDRWLRARMEDLAALSRRQGVPHFAGFLDERQRAVGENVLKKCGIAESAGFSEAEAGERDCFCAYGGYRDAGRVLLGVFPKGTVPAPSLFPLRAMGFRYRAQASLSHRDFLGTLVGAGVKREKIGDILCGEELAVAFVAEELVPFLEQQVTRVGGEGVCLLPDYDGELPVAQRFSELRDTVASPRLDAVVAALAGLSRGESARRILTGLVSVNHLPQTAVSAVVKAGDVLSLRGTGRFVIDDLSGVTRKGRLVLRARKYL